MHETLPTLQLLIQQILFNFQDSTIRWNDCPQFADKEIKAERM